MEEQRKDPDFMESLARGLEVLRCFGKEQRPLTIAQVSRMTGFSRPSAGRCLHKLQLLGYVAREGQVYSLRPKILSFGHAYLVGSPLAARAQEPLERLRDEIEESCSVGVLEEDEVYYVARAPTKRIMSIALQVGSRLPLYCTSMGRVLLSGLSRADQEAYLGRTPLEPFTDRTETEPARLLEIFGRVASDGFALVDEELEVGLRSIAVPIRRGEKVVAALNIGTQAARIPAFELSSRYRMALDRVARELEFLLL